MTLTRAPIWDELDSAKTVLLAGAGGGYDIFCGLPLWMALRNAGKRVVLANLSFSYLQSAQNARWHTPHMVQITPDSFGEDAYFPELVLLRYLRGRGLETDMYCFANEGVAPLCENYRVLVELEKPDALILIDGGTDSLMCGDESGLGTPIEDCASLYAAREAEVATKLLCCIGFGVDAFHGVCHAQFLQAVAQISQKGGFLGAFSLLEDAPETQLYRVASEFVFEKTKRPSIVSTSILAALAGHFGDHHSTPRTQGSQLFINPLMALLWTFRVEDVARRLLYPPALRQTQTWDEAATVIRHFRSQIHPKPFQNLPM